MAITDTTRKGENFVNNSANAVTIALNSTVAGSLIVLGVSTFQGGALSVSDSVNGAYQLAFETVDASGTGARLYYFPNNAGGNLTITVDPTTTAWVWAAAHEFAGAALSFPLSGTPATNTGSTSPASSGSMSPADNDVLVTAFLSLNFTGTITENAGGQGFTLSNESEDTGTAQGQPGSLVFKIISGAPGSQSHTWTLSGSWRAGIAAFKPAPADPVYTQESYRFYDAATGSGLGETP